MIILFIYFFNTACSLEISSVTFELPTLRVMSQENVYYVNTVFCWLTHNISCSAIIRSQFECVQFALWPKLPGIPAEYQHVSIATMGMLALRLPSMFYTEIYRKINVVSQNLLQNICLLMFKTECCLIVWSLLNFIWVSNMLHNLQHSAYSEIYQNTLLYYSFVLWFELLSVLFGKSYMKYIVF